MKSLLTLLSIICLFSTLTWSQAPSMHVEGELKVTPLAGFGERVVYAAPDGTLTASLASPSKLRQLVFPAQSLNIGTTGIISRDHFNGLLWQNDWSATARISIQKPIDFDESSSSVSIIVYYYPTTTNGGSIQFFARPIDFDVYDLLDDESDVLSNEEFSIGKDRILKATMSFPASSLTKELWNITIQRNIRTYPDDVVVMSVAVVYTADN